MERVKTPKENLCEKTGTAPIIINRLSRCIQAFGIPRILRPAAIGFPHHPTERENYQECVFEDKDALGQYLQRLKSYALRDFLKIQVYCPTNKNQQMGAVPSYLSEL